MDMATGETSFVAKVSSPTPNGQVGGKFRFPSIQTEQEQVKAPGNELYQRRRWIAIVGAL